MFYYNTAVKGEGGETHQQSRFINNGTWPAGNQSDPREPDIRSDSPGSACATRPPGLNI